jgi:hypothetical protein
MTTVVYFSMAAPDQNVRVGRIQDQDSDAEYVALTPAERVAMVWPLTVSAWTMLNAAQGKPFDAESGLQRDHISIQRRRG